MGKIFDAIDERLEAWIARQRMFFVATAPSGDGGHVNVSPKGPIEALRVLDGHTVAYLDLVGSGAETIAHLRENGRIVIMLCAFEGGLVLGPPDEPGHVARLRIFNPDGSEAELSGNGARQAILYLRRAGWTDARQFSIQTGAGEIRPTILSDTTCRVDMGRAVLRHDGELHGQRFQHLLIGNPQTVVEVADVDALEGLDLAALGPPIESDPQFPQRTNVSWYAVVDPSTIRARI